MRKKLSKSLEKSINYLEPKALTWGKFKAIMSMFYPLRDGKLKVEFIYQWTGTVVAWGLYKLIRADSLSFVYLSMFCSIVAFVIFSTKEDFPLKYGIPIYFIGIPMIVYLSIGV